MTMKLMLMLAGLLAVQGGVVTQDTACDGLFVNGVHYTKEVLKSDKIKNAFILSTDYNTDTLYFGFTTDYNENKKSGKINLNTKEYAEIDEIQIVDEKTHDGYLDMRFSKGIRVHSIYSNTTETYAANETIIFVLYSKPILYFAEYPSVTLYTIEDGKVALFEELRNSRVIELAIDRDNFFFFNETGLYSLKKNTKDVVQYKPVALENEGVNSRLTGLTIDRKGEVYASATSGIFFVNKYKHSLEKVFDGVRIYGVAFDSENNMIYSDAHSIIRLLPSYNQTCI